MKKLIFVIFLFISIASQAQIGNFSQVNVSQFGRLKKLTTKPVTPLTDFGNWYNLNDSLHFETPLKDWNLGKIAYTDTLGYYLLKADTLYFLHQSDLGYINDTLIKHSGHYYSLKDSVKTNMADIANLQDSIFVHDGHYYSLRDSVRAISSTVSGQWETSDSELNSLYPVNIGSLRWLPDNRIIVGNIPMVQGAAGDTTSFSFSIDDRKIIQASMVSDGAGSGITPEVRVQGVLRVLDSIVGANMRIMGRAKAETFEATDSIVTDHFKMETGAVNGYIFKCDANGIASWQLQTNSYKGTWNANTNTPTLSDATGANGDFYFVSIGDTIDLGSGNVIFTIGGTAVHNGTIWEAISPVMAVNSVNSLMGTIQLNLFLSGNTVGITGGTGFDIADATIVGSHGTRLSAIENDTTHYQTAYSHSQSEHQTIINNTGTGSAFVKATGKTLSYDNSTYADSLATADSISKHKGWYYSLRDSVKVDKVNIAKINDTLVKINSHYYSLKDSVKTNITSIAKINDSLVKHNSHYYSLRDSVKVDKVNIAKLQDSIANHTDNYYTLKDSVKTNILNIAKINDSIAKLRGWHYTLRDSVTTNITNIAKLNDSITKHRGWYYSLRDSVKVDKTDIANLKDSIVRHTDNYYTLQDSVTNSMDSITKHRGWYYTLKDSVKTNIDNIAKLQDSVTKHKGWIYTIRDTLNDVYDSLAKHDGHYYTLRDSVTAIKVGIADEKSLTGFKAGSAMSVSYNHTNRTITLTGDLTYYWLGTKHVLTSPWTSSAHDATVGAWFLMSSDGANFIWSQNPWTFDIIQVAYLYYSATASATFAGREVHGFMDWKTHDELHHNIGTWLASGGTLKAGTYAENSAVNADITPGFNTATVTDEDLSSTLPEWADGTYTGMSINSTASVFNLAQSYPFTVSTGSYINYNNVTNGAWIEGGNNKYYNVYQILVPTASDANSQAYRMIMLQPQREFATLAAAQSEATQGLYLGSLSTQVNEFKIYARITYLAEAGSASFGKVKIPTGGVTYVMGSNLSNINVSGVTSTNHANLSQLGFAGSGHTGANNTLAGFGATGQAVEIAQSTYPLAISVNDSISKGTGHYYTLRDSVRANIVSIGGALDSITRHTTNYYSLQDSVKQNITDIGKANDSITKIRGWHYTLRDSVVTNITNISKLTDSISKHTGWIYTVRDSLGNVYDSLVKQNGHYYSLRDSVRNLSTQWEVSDQELNSLHPVNLGGWRFVADQKLVTVANIPAVHALAGDTLGYRFTVDDLPMFKIYGIADGSGGVTKIELKANGKIITDSTGVELASGARIKKHQSYTNVIQSNADYWDYVTSNGLTKWLSFGFNSTMDYANDIKGENLIARTGYKVGNGPTYTGVTGTFKDWGYNTITVTGGIINNIATGATNPIQDSLTKQSGHYYSLRDSVRALPAGLALGETETTAYRGDRGKQAYDSVQAARLKIAGGRLSGPLALNDNNEIILGNAGTADSYLKWSDGMIFYSANYFTFFDVDNHMAFSTTATGVNIPTGKTYQVNDLPIIATSITDGVTTSAPNQNAVFDALALKVNPPKVQDLDTTGTVSRTYNVAGDYIHATMTIGAPTTVTLSNLVAGMSGNLTITSPATAYTITLAGYTNKISPSIRSAANQVICSGGSKTDVLSWYYDGNIVLWNGTKNYN